MSGQQDEAPAGTGRVVRHAPSARLLQVVRVTDLTPRMRRVTLSGPELAGFRSDGPTDHVRLVLADEEHELPDGAAALLDDRTLPRRDYTVRRYAPADAELDLDLVVHGSGVAGPWAARVRPGDRAGVLGPRASVVVPDTFAWYLMAVDETGLPAAARWIEGLRRDVPVRLFVEVDGPQDELPVATRAALDVTWLHRDGAEAGTTDLLERAVLDLPVPAAGDGEGYVFAAAEVGSVRRLRRHLTSVWGLPRDRCDVDGYWRRGRAGALPE